MPIILVVIFLFVTAVSLVIGGIEAKQTYDKGYRSDILPNTLFVTLCTWLILSLSVAACFGIAFGIIALYQWGASL